MSEPPTQPLPSLPSSFGDGRYVVTGQLGTGGMGLIVLARDEVLHRQVAVKVLADNLAADPHSRERFLREARASAAIHDPRVVAVHDVGEQDGRPYLVMEYVDGPSLAAILASDGPLTGDDVADVAVDALAGLASAHEAGVLHRDIKPGNLLRGPDGTVKVMDFGVAIAADASNLTSTGFVMGTAGYLAPERRRGEPATVATDLWALGATLTELLTGHPPTEDVAADVLAAREHTIPVALRALLVGVLADRPEDRPASAHDALELLGGEHQGADAAVTAASAVAETAALARLGTTVLPVGEVPADGDRPAATAPLGTGDPARWTKVAVVAALLFAVAFAIQLLVDDGPLDRDFVVELDPEDPAGTARDLAEQLRERADT